MSESGDSSIDEGELHVAEFENIQRLLHTFPKPLIALKAYGAFISQLSSPPKPASLTYQNTCFYDAIIHCNAYALRELRTDQKAVNAARDYFRLALEMFTEVKDVCYTGVLASQVAKDASFSVDEDGVPHTPQDFVTSLGMLEGDADLVEGEDGERQGPKNETLLIPHSMEDASLTLLAVTLSNWACVEQCAGEAETAAVLFGHLETFPPAADEIPLLGHRMERVAELNAAVKEIMQCNFPEASQALVTLTLSLSKASGELKEKMYEEREAREERHRQRAQERKNRPKKEDGHHEDEEGVVKEERSGGSSRSASSESLGPDPSLTHEMWDIQMLRGFTYYSMGVSEEHPCAEDAEVHYGHARESFEEAGLEVDYVVKSPTTWQMEQAEAQLQAAGGVDAVAPKEGEGQPDGEGGARLEAAAKELPVMPEAPPFAYVCSVLNTVTGKLSSILAETRAKALEREAALESANANKKGKKKMGGKGSRNKHVAQAESHYIPPPIHGDLRAFIRFHGLPVAPGMVFRAEEAFDQLRVALGTIGGGGGRPLPFTSPLPLESEDRLMAVMMVMETPLEWAVEVAASKPHVERSTVWTLRHTIPPYLRPVPAPSDPNGKERMHAIRPALRQLLPRPLPQSVVESAEKGLNAALKMVSSRLAVLIKNEKAFEERWTATERVKAALLSYYVPQMIAAFKEERYTEIRRQEIMRQQAARRLQRFFRLVVEVKPRQFGFMSAPQRREHIQYAAAVVLQKYARRYLAIRLRRTLEYQRAQRVRHIVIAQCCCRRRCAKRRVMELIAERSTEHDAGKERMRDEYAATLIQATYRCHAAQLAYWKARGWAARALRHHLRDSRHAAATRIQALARGVAVRRKHGAAVTACRFRGRNLYRSRVLRQASLTIQRYFRGWRTRNQMASAMEGCRRRIVERAAAVVEAREAERVAAELVELAARDHAAARIQSLVRMVAAKSVMKALQRDRRASDWQRGSEEDPEPRGFSLKDCEY